MSINNYFTEASAKIFGLVENLFLSPWGDVFVCGNIGYNKIGLIGVVNQAGEWLFEGNDKNSELPFSLSNRPQPNAPCFVRNIHFLSDGSVVATGRFPEGGIAKFNRDGILDKNFSERMRKLCYPLTTIICSAILGNDEILVYGHIARNQNISTAILSSDGYLLLDISKQLGKIAQATSLPNGNVLVISEEKWKFHVSVISKNGYVDMVETEKIRQAETTDSNSLGIAVSQKGEIAIWGYDKEVVVSFLKNNLEADHALTKIALESLRTNRDIQRINNDSQALWLPEGKLFFYNCGPCRNRSGIIFDPKSGFDQSLMYRFDTPGPNCYERAEKSSALWLPGGKIMMADPFIRRHDNAPSPPTTRLSLVNLE